MRSCIMAQKVGSVRPGNAGHRAGPSNKVHAMKLLLKFNLIFVLVFAAGLAATAYIARDLLRANAEAEVAGNARLLAQADVVVYDHLVGPGVMALVGAQAERIYVGKERSHHSMAQELSLIHI